MGILTPALNDMVGTHLELITTTNEAYRELIKKSKLSLKVKSKNGQAQEMTPPTSSQADIYVPFAPTNTVHPQLPNSNRETGQLILR